MFDVSEVDDRIGKCEKILQSDPNSQIFAALAEAYRKKGNLDKAFQICQNGLKIHPEYGSAHVVMAKVNLDRGLYDWAEAEARKAAGIDGRIRVVELLLAEIHIYKGEFKAATKLLRKLHNNDPDNAQIQKLLDIAKKLPEEQTIVTSGHGVDRAAKPSDKSPANVQEPAPVELAEEAPQPLSASDLLEQAVKIAGVDGALLIAKDGLVVESEWTMKMDLTACGAIIGGIGAMLDEELVRSSFGKVNSLLIETCDPTFYLRRVSKGTFLFVTNASINLGGLRMKIDALMESYR